jgi:hypothetical protein
MRRHIVLPLFVMSMVAVALTLQAQQSDPMVGTWKVNLAKSTFSPGPPPTFRSSIAIWESLGGGQFRNINDSVDAKGQPFGHTEITFRFDGADYPYTGGNPPSTRAYKKTDARTYEFVTKVNGKVTATTTGVLSLDGKTRTLTTTGTDAQGKPTKAIVLWEKQ